MSRVNLKTVESAPEGSRRSLAQIGEVFGMTPNMFKAVANSPAALMSMWGSFGALGSGRLGAALGEQIAVAVADYNNCDYCLAAHTALGGKAGVNPQAMAQAQQGRSDDPKTLAALRFALALVDRRGAVTSADIESVRAAGFDDEDLVEIVAHVALNLFTNYLNIAFAVPVDFPSIRLSKAA